MRALLLFPDRSLDWKWVAEAVSRRDPARGGRPDRRPPFDPGAGLPWNTEALVKDLELHALFPVMARGDDWVYVVARKVLLSGSSSDTGTILYRQSVLSDCLEHPDLVRELYSVTVEAMGLEREIYRTTFFLKSPDSVLRWSLKLLEGLLGCLRRLRDLLEVHHATLASEGFRGLSATLRDQLTDDYLDRVRFHLAQLSFRNGVLLSAQMGPGNKGTDYRLHVAPPEQGNWLVRILRKWFPRIFQPRPLSFGFSLHPRDDSGFRMLSEIRDRGIGLAASALGGSAEHVRDFFTMLRAELAFYVGCLNLHDRLREKGIPTCLPSPAPAEPLRLSFRGLRDVALSVLLPGNVVGNDADADGMGLIVITGANQGGKSTFLRSVGTAQLMMQAGMFVPAEAFVSSVCDSLVTHYRREEDTTLESGKLDEELGRMSEIVDRLTPHAMILFNESFSATNEREGSEIARQVTSALLEERKRMIFVTHLHEFARALYEDRPPNVLFLRADRRPDGARTLRMTEGRPLPTAYGMDLYEQVFEGSGLSAGRRKAGGAGEG